MATESRGGEGRSSGGGPGNSGGGTGTGTSSTATSTDAGAGEDGRPRPKTWAGVNDWEKHRERITELYRDQGLHLRQVQQVMMDECGFFASQRMYKTRISKWAIDKNLKAADVAAILRLQQVRAALGKKSQFTIRGRDVDFARVEQYLKRDPTLLKQAQSSQSGAGGGADDLAQDLLPGQMEAAGITCRTPSPTPPPSPSPPVARTNDQRYPHQQHQQPPLQHHHHHQHPYVSDAAAAYGMVGLPATTSIPVPMVPSHAPMPMSLATTAAPFAGMAPTAYAAPSAMSAMPLGAASMSYLPLSSTSHHPVAHAYDSRRVSVHGMHSGHGVHNTPPPVLMAPPHDPMSLGGGLSSMPSTSLSSSYSSLSDGFAAGGRQASHHHPHHHTQPHDELTRLAREYILSALQQGLWVPHGQPGTAGYSYVSTKATGSSPGGPATAAGTAASDRLTAWGREMHACRRLMASGRLDEGFRRVHGGLDALRQHVHDEDPSLLFHVLCSSAGFCAAAASSATIVGAPAARDEGARPLLRQVATMLCSHAASLARVVLGPAHPLSRMLDLYAAHAPATYGAAHLEAMSRPLAAMRDLFAEHDPAGVDPSTGPQCHRMAQLLRQHSHGGGGIVAPDGADMDQQVHLGHPTHHELHDLLLRLPAARNLHTKLQFLTTYLAYLTGQVHDEPLAVPVPASLSMSRPDSGAAATPDSAYTTTSLSATGPLMTMDAPSAVGSVGVAGGVGVSPLLSSSTTPSSSASPSLHSLAMSSTVSSAMMPRPANMTPNTTPRTVVSQNQNHSQSNGPSQSHNHSQSPSHYGGLPPAMSAYPPVPAPYHPATATTMAGPGAALAAHPAQTLGGHATNMAVDDGLQEPGALSWELGDVSNVPWM